jgi:uncharacterized protein YndB with AHSA1/START domain
MNARAENMTEESTDRIERSVVLNAPRARVWRALTNAEEFGDWFGANLKGQTFAPGQRARGHLTYKGYEDYFFDIVVDSVEPQNLMSYHWHPYPMDKTIDYDKEEPTLVTFTLTDAPNNGTRLTVVETGFDKVPPSRRLEAFRMNSGGWDGQMKRIAAHVESA